LDATVMSGRLPECSIHRLDGGEILECFLHSCVRAPHKRQREAPPSITFPCVGVLSTTLAPLPARKLLAAGRCCAERDRPGDACLRIDR
jgi:hypothetical protein